MEIILGNLPKQNNKHLLRRISHIEQRWVAALHSPPAVATSPPLFMLSSWLGKVVILSDYLILTIWSCNSWSGAEPGLPGERGKRWGHTRPPESKMASSNSQLVTVNCFKGVYFVSRSIGKMLFGSMELFCSSTSRGHWEQSVHCQSVQDPVIIVHPWDTPTHQSCEMGSAHTKRLGL